MEGRVEKISPVNKVAFDVARSFEDRRGFVDHGGGQSFQKLLHQAMQKKPVASSSKSENKPSEAYVVNVTRATQSLFYQDEAIVRERLEKLMDE